MSRTTPNQILWAIRDIEDTDTLKMACVELERMVYHLRANFNYQLSDEAHEAGDTLSVELQRFIAALPENNVRVE
jgi:hypothetical protein